MTLVASCAQPSAEADGDGPTAAIQSPTATVVVGSVGQWASVIAEHRGSVDETFDTLDSYSCVLDTLATEPMCAATFISGQLRAQTIVVELTGAADENSPTFIGEPSAEVADLVARTLNAAEHADTTTQAWSDRDCIMRAEVECNQLGAHAFQAFADLQKAFDSWEPYM